MATIIFNSDAAHAIQLVNYSRTTTYDKEQNDLVSNAYISLVPGTSTATFLNTLMPQTVSRITIRGDSGTNIYDLNDVQGRITSIQETYNGGDNFEMYVNFSSSEDLDADDGE